MSSWFGGKSKTEWKVDGLESPTTDDELKALCDKNFEEIINFCEDDSDDWTFFHESPPVSLYSCAIDGWAIKAIKSKARMQGSPEEIIHLVWGATLEERKEYMDVVELERLKSMGPDSDVVYLNHAAPAPGVSSRDFVLLRCMRPLENDSDKKTLVYASISINLEEKPFTKATRGATKSGMMVTESDEEGYCDVVMVNLVDPKGWVPSFVVNAFSKSAAQKLIDIDKYLTRKRGEENSE